MPTEEVEEILTTQWANEDATVKATTCDETDARQFECLMELELRDEDDPQPVYFDWTYDATCDDESSNCTWSARQ